MSWPRRRFSAIAFLLSLVITVLACSGEAKQGERQSSTSTSRVLYADSVVATTSPVQAAQITVNASASYDAASRYWTYSYSITNDAGSLNVLDRFAISPVRRPAQVSAPPHWVVFHGSDGDSNAVVWSVKDLGPAPQGWFGLDLFVGPYHLQPGQTLDGFVIRSLQEPNSIPYYAQAFDTLEAGGEDEVPSPPTIFNQGVTGLTLGPLFSSVVGANNDGTGAARIEFRAPVPNPSSGTVTVSYYLGHAAHVRLSVYDVAGRLVKVLRDARLPQGLYSTTWSGVSGDGKRAAAGVYFYRLTADDQVIGSRKVVLIR
jgi:hypothetical protein